MDMFTFEKACMPHVGHREGIRRYRLQLQGAGVKAEENSIALQSEKYASFLKVRFEKKNVLQNSGLSMEIVKVVSRRLELDQNKNTAVCIDMSSGLNPRTLGILELFFSDIFTQKIINLVKWPLLDDRPGRLVATPCPHFSPQIGRSFRLLWGN